MNERFVHLSVNLSLLSEGALSSLMARKGISLAEAIRRAVAVWKFAEDVGAGGGQLAVIEPGGEIHPLKLVP